jgi:hypothetical protein
MYTKMLVVVTVCGTVNGCAPREAYQGPVADFGKATEYLSEIATQQLTSERSDRRLQLIRQYLTINLKQAWATSKNGEAPMVSLPEVDTFVCQERSEVTPDFDAKDYVSAVAKAMEKTVEPPPTETDDLIKALATSYDIDVSATDNQKDVYDACIRDRNSYLQTVYLEKGRQESAALAIEGLQALAEILKEAAKASLTEIDSARRAAAMRKFLNDAQHKEQLSKAIGQLETTLTNADTRRQHLAMKTTVDRFEDFAIAMNDLNVASASECASYFALPKERFSVDHPSHAESVEFRQCYRYAWDRLSDSISELITATATYDIEADRAVRPAFDDLKKATAKLEKLADDEIDAEEAKAMLVAALRMGKVAAELKNTITSDETQAKVKEALDKIRTAL